MDMHSPIDAISQPKHGLEAEPSNPPGLSKKAQKRAAKAARLQELKLERRAREKEARKHKRRERAAAIANGELDENTSRKRRKTNTGETEIFDARVVVDLGFDELMSDKVGVSLHSCLLQDESDEGRRLLLSLLSWHIRTVQTDMQLAHFRHLYSPRLMAELNKD